MPQHTESDGETQQPAPERPVEQRRVNDVTEGTRESVADTVTPLRIAIEDLAVAAPDTSFAQHYDDSLAGIYSPPYTGVEMSDELREMFRRRECFNAALIGLFEAVLALHRDLSEEEMRSIGDILRTTGDFHLHNFITRSSVDALSSAIPALIRQHPSTLCTFLRYGTAQCGGESLSSITAHALLSSVTKEPRKDIENIFTQTLQEAVGDPSFRPGEGFDTIVVHTLQHTENPTSAILVTLRSLEYEIQQQKRRDHDYDTCYDARLRDFLTDQRLSGHTHLAVMLWLKEKGLDAADVMDWWSYGMGWNINHLPMYRFRSDEEKNERTSPYECYMRNVRRCLQLEAHSPGCLFELWGTFNLHDVGRYAPETLVAQYEERENTHKPYVLVIFPRDDHNGAFYCDADIIENLRQQLEEKGYLLRIIEGGDDILKTLARLRRDARYPLPAGLILGAHGQPSSMSFSKRHSLSLKTIEKKIGKRWEARKGMEEGMEKLFRKKAKRCPTVLISCSTGQPEGIAHVLSRYTEGTVIGPQIPTNVAAISAQFDENGKLTALVPTFHKGKMGVFEAGEEVPVAEEEVMEAIPVDEELPTEDGSTGSP